MEPDGVKMPDGEDRRMRWPAAALLILGLSALGWAVLAAVMWLL